MPNDQHYIIGPDGIPYGPIVPQSESMWPAELGRLGLVMLGPVTVESLAVAAAFLHEIDLGDDAINRANWVACVQWVLSLVADAGSIKVPS